MTMKTPTGSLQVNDETNADVSPVGDRQIGARIRRLRQQRNVSVSALSAQAGVSKSLVSQIELGRTNASVTVLKAIAKALGVPLFTLFVEEDGGEGVVRRDNRPTLRLPGSKIVRELLVPDIQRRMTLLYAHFEAGDQSSIEPSAHDGEECIVVLKGRMEVYYHGSRIDLDEGDSFYFDSTVPHLFVNASDAPAEIIVAICT